jgi:hypothetical protein
MPIASHAWRLGSEGASGLDESGKKPNLWKKGLHSRADVMH